MAEVIEGADWPMLSCLTGGVLVTGIGVMGGGFSGSACLNGSPIGGRAGSGMLLSSGSAADDGLLARGGAETGSWATALNSGPKLLL